MAVAFDAVGPSSAGTSSHDLTSLSWSHTCTGSDRLLTVAVALNPGAGAATMTATYNGVSMTSLGTVAANNQTSGFVQVWQLVAPATGANTVAIASSGPTPQSLVGGSVSFTGVDQVTPCGTSATAFGSGTAPSVAVTGTTSGNMVVDAVCTGAGITSSGQTSRWSRTDNTFAAAGNAAQSTAAAGGSVTMSYTVTDDWWGVIGVEVLAVAPPPATDPLRLPVQIIRVP